MTKTAEEILDKLDFSVMTEEEKSDWCHYGLIPNGPHWNNFDVVPKSDYICSFEVVDKTAGNKYIHMLCDLYVTQNGLGEQSVLIRSDEEWEGSYGSTPLRVLFGIPHLPWKQALNILCSKGMFSWNKKNV